MNIETAMQMEGEEDDEEEEENAEEVNTNDMATEKNNGTNTNTNQKLSATNVGDDSGIQEHSQMVPRGRHGGSSGKHIGEGGRGDSQRGSTKDSAKEMQMHSGKRGKSQLMDTGRDNKRSRFK